MVEEGKGHDIKYTEVAIEIKGEEGVPSMSSLTIGGFNLYV
jgi:hypothetical protein